MIFELSMIDLGGTAIRLTVFSKFLRIGMLIS